MRLFQLLAAFIISFVAIMAVLGSHGGLPIGFSTPGLVSPFDLHICETKLKSFNHFPCIQIKKIIKGYAFFIGWFGSILCRSSCEFTGKLFDKFH